MRYFNWKIAIVSVLVFLFPVFLYPVNGTMSNGVTTYSYGFPSPWLSVQFENRGGSLFGFEIFASDIVGFNVGILTALLDLLIVYLALSAFVKVFWTNHFAIKLTNWKERRYNQKCGIVSVESEPEDDQLGDMDYIVVSRDDDGIIFHPVEVDMAEKDKQTERAEQSDAYGSLEESDTNKTA